MKIDNKKILILGFGREGSETLKFLRVRFPDKIIGVADRLPLERMEPFLREAIAGDINLRGCFGEDYLKKIDDYDLIFKSPGIKFLPEIAAVEKKGAVISSNTELFFDFCEGVVIGITGTKGKSTTASVIYEVLEAGGLNVCFGGNIGMAPLSLLGGDDKGKIFVLELSSFQLAGLKRSPQVAVIQAIFREHLDYHGDFPGYLSAKENIVRYQREKDLAVFNYSNFLATETASRSRGRKIPFHGNETDGSRCFLDRGVLIFVSDAGGREEIVREEEIPLRGSFNIQNVMPAVVVGREFGISSDVIAGAIKGFRSLPHRLEFVREADGISFYNDSLATIPEAAIAALEAFPDKKIVLIAGGFDRGQDFSGLGRKIAELYLSGKILGVVLFPATGEGLWASIREAAGDGVGLPPNFFVNTMDEAVSKAVALAERGSVVLLSPAAASFGVFKNYAERGEAFKSEARKIAEKKF